MSKEDELWAIIEREQIVVIYQDLQAVGGRHGAYYFEPEVGPIIALDHSTLKSDRLHLSVLAEELGHHMTVPERSTTMHWNYSLDIQESRDEVRALRWATDRLLPTFESIDVIQFGGVRSTLELAEHFGVTDWLAWRKIAFLREDIRAKHIRIKHADMFEAVFAFSREFMEEVAAGTEYSFS